MQAVAVIVRGEEIPIPRLSYEDVESLVVDWRSGGISDPIGQITSWLWDKIRGLVTGIGDMLKSAINAAAEAIKSGISAIIEGLRSAIIGAISAVKSGIDGLVSGISGMVSGILSALSSGISGLMGFISGIGSSILSAVTGIASTIGGTLSSFFGSLASMIGGAIGTFVSMLSGVASSIMGAISGIGARLGEMFRGIVSAVMDALSGLRSALTGVISGLMSALGSLGSSIAGAVSSAMDRLLGLFRDLGSTIRSLISNLLDAIKSGLQQVGGAVADALSGIYSFFGSAFEQITSNLLQLGQLITGFVNAVAEFGGKIWSALGEIGQMFSNLASFIAEGLARAWDALVKALQPIFGPVVDFFSNAGKALADFFTKTVPDFFTRTVPDFLDNVVKFFTGDVPAFFSALWSGLVEFTRPVWEPIKNFFDWAWENLADLFGRIIPEFFTKTIPEFVGRVVKFFTGDVPSFFSALWSGLVEFTRPVWEPIKKFLEGVWEVIKDPWGSLKKLFEDLAKLFEPIIKPIGEALAPVGDALSAVGKFFAKDIPEFFTKAIPEFFTKTLPQICHDMWDWFMTGIQDLGDRVSGFLRFLGEAFNSAIVALRGVVEASFSPIVSEAIGKAKEAAQACLKPGSPPKEIEEFVKALMDAQKRMIDELKRRVRKSSPGMNIPYSDIWAWAGLGMALSIGVQAAGLLVDLVHPMKNMQVRKLAKSAVDMMGGFFITSSLAASFTFFVLHQALRRHYYRSFPVVLPGPEQITRMWVRMRLAEKDVDGCLAELGYAEAFREGFKDLAVSLLSPGQVIQALGRELIGEEEALREVRKHGYIDRDGIDRAKILLEVERPLPTVNDLIDFWRLGKVKDDDLKKYIKWRGYREEFVEAYYASRLRMPSVSEMIAAVVKEALDPLAFKELLRRQGLIELDKYQQELGLPGIAVTGLATVEETLGKPRGPVTWADILWEAHWRLPPLERVVEFANRASVGMIHVAGKQVTLKEEEAAKAVLLYSRLHDFKPVPRAHTVLVGGRAEEIRMPVSDAEMMEATRFRILTRIESRFVRRWGLISEEDFRRLLVAQGVSPYVKIRTVDGQEISMVDALMKAEFLQDLLEERTHLRNSILAAFQRGYNVKISVLDPFSGKEVALETLKIEEALKAIRFRSEEASWLAQSARIRRVVELRNDAVRGAVEDFLAGAASVGELEDALKALIDDEEVRRSVVEYAIKRRALARYRRMANRLDRALISEASTMLRLYEQGFAPRSEAEAKLQSLVDKGLMLPEEKDALLSISDERRKRELRELAVRALAKKLSRGEISVKDFIASAEKIGVDKEFVEGLLENYATMHTLTVGQLVSYADEVPIPSDLLERKLDALRVPDDERAIIREVVRRRPIRDDISSLVYWMTSLASSLDILPEDVSMLKEVGLTDNELKIRRKIVEMLNRKAVRARIRAALETLLREQYQAQAKGRDPGLITLDQFVKAMKALKYPEEYVIARAQEIVASAANVKLKDFEDLKAKIVSGRWAA